MEAPYKSLDLALKLQEAGVSLIADSLGEEVCFASLTGVVFGMQERGERHKVLLRIESIQVDNQMEGGNKPVVLANRGGREYDNGSRQEVSRERDVAYLCLQARVS